MKILLTILLLATFTFAQEPAKKTDAPAPSAEQQKALKEVLAASDKAQADLESAKKTADFARQRFFSELFRIMAELGLKPSEYTVSLQPDGNIGFEKNKVAQVDKKPEETRKP